LKSSFLQVKIGLAPILHSNVSTHIELFDRFVVEDGRAFVFNLLSPVTHNFKSLKVLVNLFDFCESEQSNRAILVSDSPCKCKLSHSATELFSEGSQIIEHFEGFSFLFFTF